MHDDFLNKVRDAIVSIMKDKKKNNELTVGDKWTLNELNTIIRLASINLNQARSRFEKLKIKVTPASKQQQQAGDDDEAVENNVKGRVVASHKHIEKKLKSIMVMDKISIDIQILQQYILTWCTDTKFIDDWLSHYELCNTSLEKYNHQQNPYYTWLACYNEEAALVGRPVSYIVSGIKVERTPEGFYGPKIFKLFTNEFYNYTSYLCHVIKMANASNIHRVKTWDERIAIVAAYVAKNKTKRAEVKKPFKLFTPKEILLDQIKTETVWEDDVIGFPIRMPALNEKILVKDKYYDIGVLVRILCMCRDCPAKEHIENMLGYKLRLHGPKIPAALFERLKYTAPSSYVYGQHRYYLLKLIFGLKLPRAHPYDMGQLADIIWRFSHFYINFIHDRKNSPILELVLINLFNTDRFKMYKPLIPLIPHLSSPKFDSVKSVWMFRFLPEFSNLLVSEKKIPDSWYTNDDDTSLDDVYTRYAIDHNTEGNIISTSKI